MIRSRILVMALPVLLQACAYSIHDVHVSGYEPYTPQAQGRIVTGHGEQFVIMGFKQNVDYVDQAVAELMEACPKGDIVGVVTEYQTALGFFSWNNHVYLKGLCTTGQSVKRSSIDEGEDFLF